jgi:hypothetical protein
MVEFIVTTQGLNVIRLGAANIVVSVSVGTAP